MPRIRLSYILLLVGLLVYSTSLILNRKSAKNHEIVRQKPNRKADPAPRQPQPKDFPGGGGSLDETVERLRVAAEHLGLHGDVHPGEVDPGGHSSSDTKEAADPIAEILANLQLATTTTVTATPTPRVFTEADWRTHYSPMLTNPSPGNDFLPERTLANAAIVILCRNSELQPLRRTIREFEDRFNRKFGYPYVLLNDEPFTQEFKEAISNLTRANTTFGMIPEDMWSWPPWIDQETALRYMQRLEAQRVMYGGSLSYRHMCRFNSGFFYRHPLLQGYDWYWRVEPGVNFYCDLDYDPFLWMQNNGKRYGFNIILREIRETIPSLYEHTLKYAEAANLSTRLLRFFGEPSQGWKGYNLCHFWSNFEIADLRLWRDPVYQKYFDYLDSTGNFFYERWGDAPVHTLALALMLNKSEIHFFNDIGYKHDIFSHCVDDEESGLSGKCMCPTDRKNFDWDTEGSCLKDWLTYPTEGYRWDFLPNKTAVWEDPPHVESEHNPADDYPGFELKTWVDELVPVKPGTGEGKKVIKVPDVVWQVVKQGKLEAVPERIRAVWQAKGWLDWIFPDKP